MSAGRTEPGTGRGEEPGTEGGPAPAAAPPEPDIRTGAPDASAGAPDASSGGPDASSGGPDAPGGGSDASAEKPDPRTASAPTPTRRAATPLQRLAGVWRRPALRWPRRIASALVLVLLLPPLAAGIALRVNYGGDPAAGTYTRHRDALWMGHAWVDGRKKDADVRALAARLRTTGVRDLYVHAGPLEHDGTLPASAYPKARWLIGAIHRELPGVRVQAWLGDELATEGPVGLRLERAATRAAVVRSAGQVLDAGFAGAHFDLEPLHSGDADYLSLLGDLRRVTRVHGALLSVAAHQIDPLPSLHSVWGTVTGHPKWWSQEFFGQVARRVDQIAVMSYDTALPLESLYGGYVAQQTSLALEVTPAKTDLLMGMPFYYEDNMDHHGSAETVGAAVRGARLGLSRTDRTRENFGVAAYVDFAAREKDWTAYERGWVR
ncbi:hypothetical protein [Streptomyces sp. NPDC002769]|uniref:hypothetical protein n=1 Tax=Streptomyces sp. NPDC002769 TaxID=3154542 RepID=UPI00332BCCD6